jgi:translation initiation factor IF-1
MEKIIKETTVNKQSSNTTTLTTIIPAKIRDLMWLQPQNKLIWELTKNDDNTITVEIKKK